MNPNEHLKETLEESLSGCSASVDVFDSTRWQPAEAFRSQPKMQTSNDFPQERSQFSNHQCLSDGHLKIPAKPKPPTRNNHHHDLASNSATSWGATKSQSFVSDTTSPEISERIAEPSTSFSKGDEDYMNLKKAPSTVIARPKPSRGDYSVPDRNLQPSLGGEKCLPANNAVNAATTSFHKSHGQNLLESSASALATKKTQQSIQNNKETPNHSKDIEKKGEARSSVSRRDQENLKMPPSKVVAKPKPSWGDCIPDRNLQPSLGVEKCPPSNVAVNAPAMATFNKSQGRNLHDSSAHAQATSRETQQSSSNNSREGNANNNATGVPNERSNLTGSNKVDTIRAAVASASKLVSKESSASNSSAAQKFAPAKHSPEVIVIDDSSSDDCSMSNADEYNNDLDYARKLPAVKLEGEEEKNWKEPSHEGVGKSMAGVLKLSALMVSAGTKVAATTQIAVTSAAASAAAPTQRATSATAPLQRTALEAAPAHRATSATQPTQRAASSARIPGATAATATTKTQSLKQPLEGSIRDQSATNKEGSTQVLKQPLPRVKSESVASSNDSKRRRLNNDSTSNPHMETARAPPAMAATTQLALPPPQLGHPSRRQSNASTLSSAPSNNEPWMIQDIAPRLSNLSIQFLQSTGIETVEEFLRASNIILCIRFVGFDGFKVGCSFMAWKKGKKFSDACTLELARNSIRKWKHNAELWWEKTTGSKWDRTIRPSIPVQMPAENNLQLQNDDRDSLNRNVVTSTLIVSSSMGEVDNMKDQNNGREYLRNILSFHEATTLEQHFGIFTASQLISANKKALVKKLAVIMKKNDFPRRTKRDVEIMCEGIHYCWLLRARELIRQLEPEQRARPVTTLTRQKPTNSSAQYISSLSQTEPCSDSSLSSCEVPADPTQEPLPIDFSDTYETTCFQTPLSYAELYFLKSTGILSDEQLASMESKPSDLSKKYAAFLNARNIDITPEEAAQPIGTWRNKACEAIKPNNNENIESRRLPYETRITKDADKQGLMDNVFHLCRTVPDEHNGNLPTRTIVSYDMLNYVIYEFQVSIRESGCGPNAGNGAFLTFKGAKILKNTSRWKVNRTKKLPTGVQTRNVLVATFSESERVTCVTLKGTNLHGDEEHYGPEKEDSVGVWNEFSLSEDFIETPDNITFSSNHPGCGMVELDRYGPLLPEDRKTTLLFDVKDFIFSSEPQSWRFNVGSQISDFTDDATGAPHEVAKANVAMYVNEVGHNMNLVENVYILGRERPRSVYYYISINEPMKKGETVELLVDYKGEYESMRERRGYGKANLNGVKSDKDDNTRVRRNLIERTQLESVVTSYNAEDVETVTDFLIKRVWDGVATATRQISPSAEEINEADLLRQCIARRRIHWISQMVMKQYGKVGRNQRSSPISSTQEEDSNFKVGMMVFVNEWMEAGDPRPPFTGVATVTKVFKDSFNRSCVAVSYSGGKSIGYVPEGVLSEPTEEDFENAPRRLFSNWLQWKEEQKFPQKRESMFSNLKQMEWDPSFLSNLPPSELRDKITNSLKWEVLEELLYQIAKEKRIQHPLSENHWCPISTCLLTKCLLVVAEFMIPTDSRESECSYPEILQSLFGKLMSTMLVGVNAAKTVIVEVADPFTNTDKFAKYLSFVDESASLENGFKQNSKYLISDASQMRRVPLEDCTNGSVSLDEEWYIINQVLLVTHVVGSSIDWDPCNSRPHGDPIYSFKKVCQFAGVDYDLAKKSLTPKMREWGPLVVIPL